MNNQPIKDDDMPPEIDFSKGVRGLHHVPPDARVGRKEQPTGLQAYWNQLLDILEARLECLRPKAPQLRIHRLNPRKLTVERKPTDRLLEVVLDDLQGQIKVTFYNSGHRHKEMQARFVVDPRLGFTLEGQTAEQAAGDILEPIVDALLGKVSP